MVSPHEHRVLLLMTTATYRATSFLEAAEALGVPAVVGSDRRRIEQRGILLGQLCVVLRHKSILA